MFDPLPRDALDSLGLRFGTDKASATHDYLRFYEFFLAPLREHEFTLLELGVGPPHNMGKSLLMWHEYFPKAMIVGVDNRPETRSVEEGRISIEIGNLARVDFISYLASTYRPAVVIDDASHLWAHQVLALENLFWALLPGGIYILEDINTSFGDLAARYGVGQYVDTYSYVSVLACLVCGRANPHPSFERLPPSAMQQALATEIDVVSIYRHSAVFMKKTGDTT